MSVHLLRQLFLSAESAPSTVRPPPWTVTLSSTPLEAATCTPLSGRTFLPPFAGVIVAAASGALAADSLAALPLEEQAAVGARSIPAATGATQRPDRVTFILRCTL